MNKGSHLLENDPKAGPGLQEAYRLLVLEVEQLRKAQQDIKRKLEKAETARDLLRQILSSPYENLSDVGILSHEGGAKKKAKRHRQGSRTGEVVVRAKKILKAAGRPLDRADLLREIEASGFSIQASNPARFIGRTLWGSDEFVHIPKEGYWLKGEDVPHGTR
ncbi:hypothetical protein [Rhizobium leguminosarum]|uniref:hypothetical protein n=1 Tax=Rhizobium leguminosarum TaxID=384 RepID=UPI003F9DBE9C